MLSPTLKTPLLSNPNLSLPAVVSSAYCTHGEKLLLAALARIVRSPVLMKMNLD